jgi:hypothetical protein
MPPFFVPLISGTHSDCFTFRAGLALTKAGGWLSLKKSCLPAAKKFLLKYFCGGHLWHALCYIYYIESKKIKEAVKMKATVKCPNWNESDGLNGAVMFCSAGAFGRKLSAMEASEYGCTALKREKCLKVMMDSIGYGLVPEVSVEIPVTELPGRIAAAV